MKDISRICWGIVFPLALLLQACATQSPAPIEAPGQKQGSPVAVAAMQSIPAVKQVLPSQPVVRNGRYTVQSGDTLYAIAWRLGVDHRKIIEWNTLRNPDRIMVGQSLIVAPPSTEPATAALPARVVPAQPMRPTEASSPEPASSASVADSRGPWVWPADGKARRSVSATGSSGLQIRGERGQPVRAAAAGEVVYGGSGLRGYGQLLILKHDELYLSAYAHNDKLLVKEGQRVERGQGIALMGDSGASEVMLHFEIRKGGKAVDPTGYLPAR